MCRKQCSKTRTWYRCIFVQGTLVVGRDAGFIAGRTGVRMCDYTTETPTLSLMEEFPNESFRYWRDRFYRLRHRPRVDRGGASGPPPGSPRVSPGNGFPPRRGGAP